LGLGKDFPSCAIVQTTRLACRVWSINQSITFQPVRKNRHRSQDFALSTPLSGKLSRIHHLSEPTTDDRPFQNGLESLLFRRRFRECCSRKSLRCWSKQSVSGRQGMCDRIVMFLELTQCNAGKGRRATNSETTDDQTSPGCQSASRGCRLFGRRC
jgi:hypothetical protein